METTLQIGDFVEVLNGRYKGQFGRVTAISEKIVQGICKIDLGDIRITIDIDNLKKVTPNENHKKP